MTTIHSFDVLIIGSGAAGLALALRLSSHLNIAILSKGTLNTANTFHAQGGVAAVLDVKDSMAAHIQDTLTVGAGLCRSNIVEHTVHLGPAIINWLQDLGVAFSRNTTSDHNRSPDFHLTQEGGHSHRRVVHAADATGLAIANSLIHQVQDRPNIQLLQHHIAIDLITSNKINLPEHQCLGAYVLDHQADQVAVLQAKYCVLATGGASKAYLYTTNPNAATGDGIAMAWRAGCRVANMEFNQFHPTCLYHPQSPSLLISEAVRGEGGHLLLPNGERFMHHYHDQAELAPRDVVARSIDHEMKRLGADHLLLDISHQSKLFILDHFPNIYNRCLKVGIDITQQAIPVVPAAHYTCGGVLTNLQGVTDVPGLLAIGETAFTGLHGANRMASNSLLECLAFAFNAADYINQQSMPSICVSLPPWDDSRVTNSDEDVVISHNWGELRRFMWNYVGIVRTNKRLQRAKHRIDLLQREINEYYRNYKISSDLIELRNLVLVADLIVSSALQRKESRGLHYTLDYPNTTNNAKDTILTPFTASVY